MKSPNKEIYEKKIGEVVKALNKNRFDARFFQSREDLYDELKKMIPAGSTVAKGGSVTLEEAGVMDFIEEGDYDFINPKEKGISDEEAARRKKERLFADYFFMGTNAVTEAGELYNVDAFGTRLAPFMHGPKNVVVIVGSNKIVKDVDAAVERNKAICAPVNAERLKRDTPCRKTGRCMECSRDDRICTFYVLSKFQATPGRIKVFFLNEELGY